MTTISKIEIKSVVIIRRYMVWGEAFFHVVKQYIKDVLFPVFCLGCRREGEWICQDCLAQIPPLTQTSCFSCGVTLRNNACCDVCRTERCVDVYWSLYSHQIPLMSDMIEQLKYHGASDVVQVVSTLCARHQYIQSLVSCVDIIIPVPLHPVRFRERGFNQSEYIAYAIGSVVGVPVVCSVLVRNKKTKQQAMLSLQERKENVVDAFVCIDSDMVRGRRVVLVDDVLTSASTVDACAVSLKKAGVQSVYVLTLARG